MRDQDQKASVAGHHWGTHDVTKATGIILRVRTRRGHAEAEHLGHTETGQRRWRIKSLSAAETFDGTPEQAVAVMKECLVQQTRREAERT